MAVRVTLNCKLKTKVNDALVNFLEENLPRVRAFSGCQYVDVLFDIDNKEMLLDEQWESIQHHQEYIQYIQEAGVMEQLLTYLECPPDVKYFAASEL